MAYFSLHAAPTQFMLTGELKSKIDQIWNAFWSGGIANPIEVIEQITYLLFLRRLDDLHVSKFIPSFQRNIGGQSPNVAQVPCPKNSLFFGQLRA